MRCALGCVLMSVSGCVSISDMSAAQLRASNGIAQCAQVTSLYGRGSSITVNVDDIRKGATARGRTSIRCGDATMVIDTDIGVAPGP
jgi:hypothetical protein